MPPCGGLRTGEIRHQAGALPTDYTYTGQYSNTADFGLMYYRARWYDPALGRFTQADTIVPGAGNPSAWDRYAYALNNSLRYTDPSGHFPWVPVIVAGLVTAGVAAAHAFGLVPDYRGVAIAERYMNPKTDSIIVAAGIAVQSEWYGPWDTRQFAPNGTNSGLGIAQVSDKQMVQYGLENLDQTDPMVAVQAMESRIKLVQNECAGCDATDLFIAAALAQNGSGFTADSMKQATTNSDGTINWTKIFKHSYDTPSASSAQIRQALTGYQFDTQFMLKLYTQDVKKLLERGWTLPSGYEDIDWDRINRLIEMDLNTAQ